MKLCTKLRRALRGLNGCKEVKRRLIHPLLAVALLAVFLLPALTSLPVSADAATSGTTNWLNGVWGSSPSDVFAVGERGTILHYDGSAWSAMASGTSNRLNGVWGSSSSDVFAVGEPGTILHYDGSAWSAMTSGATRSLRGVWGSSSSDVFVAGGYGTILYYNGTILHHIEATTTTIVASSVNPSVHGQSVTFTAVVSPTVPGAHTPSGTVIFKEGTTTLGNSTLNNDMATYSTSTLSVGNHSITAIYGGDTNFAGSTSSASIQTVDAAPAPMNWDLISGITVGAIVVIAALVYFLVIKRRARRAKINWFWVGPIIAAVGAAVAVVMIVPSMTCQQEQQGPDGIIFGFYGGGTTREPATETMVQIAIAHMCEVNDELVLEKVEIYGESEIPVKSFAVNKTLNSVFEKQKRLDELLQLANTTTVAGEYERIMQEAAELAEEIRAESFSTAYFTIDLRQIKQSLTVGYIPIIAKATLFHNGKRLTLERELIVEYRQSLIIRQK